MFSMRTFYKEYDTDITEMTIRGKPFRFLVPASIDRFIDPQDVLLDFPLWSKIWEASIILADYLSGIPQEQGKQILEIGAGLGVVGITAAAFGHSVTITEYDPHALDFIRANTRLNDCQNAEIRKLDWNKPDLDGDFDMIAGSEVIYHERYFEPLLRVFKTFLKPDGEIILTGEMRSSHTEFLRKMNEHFNIQIQRKLLGTEDKKVQVFLFRMTVRG